MNIAIFQNEKLLAFCTIEKWSYWKMNDFWQFIFKNDIFSNGWKLSIYCLLAYFLLFCLFFCSLIFFNFFGGEKKSIFPMKKRYSGLSVGKKYFFWIVNKLWIFLIHRLCISFLKMAVYTFYSFWKTNFFPRSFLKMNSFFKKS